MYTIALYFLYLIFGRNEHKTNIRGIYSRITGENFRVELYCSHIINVSKEMASFIQRHLIYYYYYYYLVPEFLHI